ncbi:MAG: hypothetical protein KAJ19_23550 [Gammaproteobacteria bacterium]|nr:hypothetical protein [Gammaproteobacteria bacterium]
MRKFVEINEDGNVICEIDSLGNGEQFSDKPNYIDITDIEESKRPRGGHKHTGGKNFTNPARDMGKKHAKTYDWFESMLDTEIFISVSQQVKAKVEQTIKSIDDFDKLDGINGFFFGALVEYIEDNNSVPDQADIDKLIIQSEKIIKALNDRTGE